MWAFAAWAARGGRRRHRHRHSPTKNTYVWGLLAITKGPMTFVWAAVLQTYFIHVDVPNALLEQGYSHTSSLSSLPS
jgi:hypothetical protein